MQIARNLLRVLVASAALSSAFAQSEGYSLFTITNPTPSIGDQFGYSVAALAEDWILIGAPHDDTSAAVAGAVYLFNTNGILFTTFTNPSPARNDHFGFSVAAFGSDRVLVGAPYDDQVESDSGAAYLFSLNGTLLATFTNPPPSTDDWFGFSVAAVGADRVLIGTPGKGPYDAGTAYLFSTNGNLITTFNAGATITSGIFGWSVAAVGKDRVLIGAPLAPSVTTGLPDAGTVYLFGTDGARLATFNNPTPAANDRFGCSVAAVGSDRVLIGASGDNIGVGAAYLFSVAGALLTTITNPTSASGDAFGQSVATIGSDRLLIGAYGANMGIGAAYLFSTNGELLATFINPPSTSYYFGNSVAAMGKDGVLIGSPEGYAGAVHLFSAIVQTSKIPRVEIRLTTTNSVAVSWPSPSTGWTLQENTNGVSSVNWSNAPGPIQDDGTNKTFIVNPPTGNRFYRLFKP